MAKAELKTKLNDASVIDFINTVADEQWRNDCFEILTLMQQITKIEQNGADHRSVALADQHRAFDAPTERCR